MTDLKIAGKIEQLSGRAVFCGVPLGAGSVDLFGGITLGGSLPSMLALGAFLGAGIWMFRRWGSSSLAPASEGAPHEPGEDTRQRERDLIKV
jgi:hypothetical protein